jgi:SAM-dependent methyltransferase
VEGTFTIDVLEVEKYLKKHSEGPEVEIALKCRTISHWMDPAMDPMSKRMIPAYTKLCELVEYPFNILDAGCMCGFLKHFMEQRISKSFRYIGMDMWQEALTVAKDMDPHIEVYKKDILEDELMKVDYVWCSNIYFADPETVIKKLTPYATKAAFFAMPSHCGDYFKAASDCGFTTNTWTWDDITLVQVYAEG